VGLSEARAINLMDGAAFEIEIVTKNDKISVDDYKAMVSFLSRELHVRVEGQNEHSPRGAYR
jgi:hypothetical protein